MVIVPVLSLLVSVGGVSHLRSRVRIIDIYARSRIPVLVRKRISRQHPPHSRRLWPRARHGFDNEPCTHGINRWIFLSYSLSGAHRYISYSGAHLVDPERGNWRVRAFPRSHVQYCNRDHASSSFIFLVTNTDGSFRLESGAIYCISMIIPVISVSVLDPGQNGVPPSTFRNLLQPSHPVLGIFRAAVPQIMVRSSLNFNVRVLCASWERMYVPAEHCSDVSDRSSGSAAQRREYRRKFKSKDVKIGCANPVNGHAFFPHPGTQPILDRANERRREKWIMTVTMNV